MHALLFVVAVQAVGFFGGFSTAGSIDGWYASLVRPVFAPPNWVFGPVWFVLYAFIGIAWYRLYSMKKSKVREKMLELFYMQLVLNALWTPVFFGAHATVAALVMIVLMDVIVFGLLMMLRKYDTKSYYLLLPYWAWIMFATLLNAGFVILN